MELAKRNEVPIEQTWDLSLIYPTEEAMQADADKAEKLCGQMEADYKGKLNDPDTINRCLDDLREMERLLTLVGNYCGLAVEVDYYNTYNMDRSQRMERLSSRISASLSFIDSEICEVDEAVIREAIRRTTAN